MNLKFIKIFVVLIFTLPIIELARERIVYEIKTYELETAYQSIQIGMTKEQVNSLAEKPSVTFNELGEIWHFNAASYEGFLWRMVGFTTIKGHFGIALFFDESGKVINKYGGVN